MLWYSHALSAMSQYRTTVSTVKLVASLHACMCTKILSTRIGTKTAKSSHGCLANDHIAHFVAASFVGVELSISCEFPNSVATRESFILQKLIRNRSWRPLRSHDLVHSLPVHWFCHGYPSRMGSTIGDSTCFKYMYNLHTGCSIPMHVTVVDVVNYEFTPPKSIFKQLRKVFSTKIEPAIQYVSCH